MRRALLLLVLASAAVVAAPADVSAQLSQQQAGQARRPYGGLFGGGRANIGGSGHTLDLSGSFGHGYDDDLRIDVFGAPIVTPTGPTNPSLSQPVLRSGSFSHASGGMNYGFTADTVNVAVSANGMARYYRDDVDPLVGTGSVNGSMGVKLTERTSLSGSANIGVYQQNLAFVGGIGGGDPFAGAPTTFIDGGTYASAATDFTLSHQVASRVSVNGGYGLYWNDVTFVPGAAGYDGQTARAGVSVQLTRGVNANVTYRYTVTAAGNISGYNGHGVDFSLDFGRALSLSRNQSIGFGVGMSGVNDLQGNTKYYMTGQATYRYDLGQSWGISAGYFRSVDFFQTLAQPVFLDTGQVSFGGSIGKRVSLNTSVGVVTGLIGLTEPTPRYYAGSGSVGTQIGLTRKLALGFTYSFYTYRIDENAVLPIGMLSRFDRQSVALSLEVWVPVLSGSRRLNASR